MAAFATHSATSPTTTYTRTVPRQASKHPRMSAGAASLKSQGRPGLKEVASPGITRNAATSATNSSRRVQAGSLAATKGERSWVSQSDFGWAGLPGGVATGGAGESTIQSARAADSPVNLRL